MYGAIEEKCRELRAELLAIGGVADHVHVLVRLPATLAVATLVQQIKGASSHVMTHVCAPRVAFKWQGAYGAFTVDQAGLAAVRTYIANQKTHHATHTLIDAWEHWAD